MKTDEPSATQDNRRTYRHLSDVPIQIIRKGSDDRPVAQLKDISFTGLAFISDIPFEMDEIILIRFPKKKGGFKMAEKIVRVSTMGDKYNIGAEHEDIGDESPFELMEKITLL